MLYNVSKCRTSAVKMQLHTMQLQSPEMFIFILGSLVLSGQGQSSWGQSHQEHPHQSSLAREWRRWEPQEWRSREVSSWPSWSSREPLDGEWRAWRPRSSRPSKSSSKEARSKNSSSEHHHGDEHHYPHRYRENWQREDWLREPTFIPIPIPVPFPNPPPQLPLPPPTPPRLPNPLPSSNLASLGFGGFQGTSSTSILPQNGPISATVTLTGPGGIPLGSTSSSSGILSAFPGLAQLQTSLPTSPAAQAAAQVVAAAQAAYNAQTAYAAQAAETARAATQAAYAQQAAAAARSAASTASSGLGLGQQFPPLPPF